MNVLNILGTIFLYIKNLFHLKDFGTECAPYLCLSNQMVIVKLAPFDFDMISIILINRVV